ncbi:hypothetical protein [Streptomyces sp. NPDC046685]|uniref:hypothetical protein n=1 Tax=Streptomyces sp. NPDC046685 TaxID=3157202 RepID=UPI0033D4CE0D
MRITDGRTHEAVELPADRSRLLRMSVHLPLVGHTPTVADARVLVTADVLLRAVEAGGRQLAWVCELPDPSAGRDEALRALMGSLGVHPPSACMGSGETEEVLGGPADVNVFGNGRRDAEQGVWLEVGGVRGAGAQDVIPAEGKDLLALRLELLGRPYRRPIALTPLETGAAEQKLRLWRDRVAQWACWPSKPIPEEYRRRADDALSDDLGTPAVLGLLCRAEAAADVPEGAKFELFAHLDRILGLELIREIGRVPLPEAG